MPAAEEMERVDLWRAPVEASGERLDRHLAAHYEVARNRVKIWIQRGQVTVDGRTGKPGLLLAGGEEIRCRPLPQVDESRIEAEAGSLEVLYEDSDLVAVDKPAGLAVHPGAGRGSGTLVNRLVGRYPEMASIGGSGRPGIVHRLDKDTTGVMVVARTPEAYVRLSEAFAQRAIDKRYLAITYGAPAPAAGIIDLSIGRHPRRRTEMTVRPDGRPAVTHYRTIAAAGGLALLDLILETGRTHQIRVHLKARGHPLVGDPTYGEARWKALAPVRQATPRAFSRPALHAWRLGLAHPRTAEPMTFEAPVPSDLRQLWATATGTAFPEPER